MVDLLVITSCIKPIEQEFLKLSDWRERYKQTIDSLKFYIDSCCFDKIVLCDGSGFEFNDSLIHSYASKKNIKLETLSFVQNQERVKEFGKGYGEGEIMKYIIHNSELFNNSNGFIKITGRLIVDNISDIVKNIDISNCSYFNIIASRIRGSVDTRVYAISTKQYVRYFQDAYLNVDDSIGNTYEIVFGRTIKENNLLYKPLPSVPILVGFSGTENKKYKKNSIYYAEVMLTKLGLMNTFLAQITLWGLTAFNRIVNKVAAK